MRSYDVTGHYSDLIKVPTGHFKLSGVKSWDGGTIKDETVSEQFDLIMDHLRHSLDEASLDISDITFVSVALSDLSTYSELNTSYARGFPHKPRRAGTGATLRNGALVELIAEGWAADA